MLNSWVITSPDPLPQDLASAHAMILAQREALMLAQSETQVGRLEIERLKLMLAKLRREQFGQSSERGKQLIEQLELAIEDLEESQAVEESQGRGHCSGSGKGKAGAQATGPPQTAVQFASGTKGRATALHL